MSGRLRSWTDEQLIEAVARSATLLEVLERLGLKRGGGSLAAVRNRMLQLGLAPPQPELLRSPNWSVDPATLSTARPRGRTWSDADLAWAVATNFSMAAVIRALGLKVGGTVYPMLRKRIQELGLDTSHWTGKAWTRGRKVSTRTRRPLSEILVRDSDFTRTHELKLRLFSEGLKDRRCEGCGLTQWRGREIPLQLDHVNGLRNDNRLENLRILCPNCHAQTETWCARNIGRPTGQVPPVAESENAPVAEWQTRGIQNPLSGWVWGFESPPGHSNSCARALAYTPDSASTPR